MTINRVESSFSTWTQPIETKKPAPGLFAQDGASAADENPYDLDLSVDLATRTPLQHATDSGCHQTDCGCYQTQNGCYQTQENCRPTQTGC
jgi:hypothetical protein